MFSKANSLIPKKIHFIWLGKLLSEEGRDNLVHWRKTNPDYDINLWVDSALFPDNFEEENQYIHFMEWAKANNIRIRDVKEIHDEMYNKDFYDDAVLGLNANFGEASDIARLEILYLEGGIYFDAKDIFPDQPMGEIKAKNGFLCHILPEDAKINNDILAATPRNNIIQEIRKKINENYIHLFNQEERTIYAHRSSIYGGFELTKDSRKHFTIKLSGPGPVAEVIHKIAPFPEQEEIVAILEEKGLDANEFIFNKYYKSFYFDENFYEVPSTQALEWGVNALLNDVEALKSHLNFGLTLIYKEKIKSALADEILSEGKLKLLDELSKITPNSEIDLYKIFKNKLNDFQGEVCYPSKIKPLLKSLQEHQLKLTGYLDKFSSELTQVDKILMLENFYAKGVGFIDHELSEMFIPLEMPKRRSLK